MLIESSNLPPHPPSRPTDMLLHNFYKLYFLTKLSKLYHLLSFEAAPPADSITKCYPRVYVHYTSEIHMCQSPHQGTHNTAT